ncbi:MAG: lytic transglycosylase domain-containing protein [Candidatus Riflebacteria bacterium]|nr:lytic transglycosylase domain-containing protein [Candidatus Riflebacteria bacterium]
MNLPAERNHHYWSQIMLENMNRLVEKIDALNKSLSIYAPKHKKKINVNNFAKQLELATSGNNISACSPATTAKASNQQLGESIKEDINNLVNKYSKEYNIEPDLIKQLISVASGNNPNAVGKNGQLGLMQLNPSLLSQFGVTNPFDPQQNIMAGTQHLSQLLQNNNGNLPLALAAYNTDPKTVKRFGGIPPYLDTRNFVNQVISGLNK